MFSLQISFSASLTLKCVALPHTPKGALPLHPAALAGPVIAGLAVNDRAGPKLYYISYYSPVRSVQTSSGGNPGVATALGSN